jgi:phosphohistidine phosphatase SixA
MKCFIVFLAIFITQFSANGQVAKDDDKTTIYLVRHAEKEKGDDPLLTSEGKKRAGDLMRALKSKHIQRIYVTEYRRTQMTGDSLRIQVGIDTVHYLADTTGDSFVAKLKEQNDFGKAILVIGHSNTLAFIIERLCIAEQQIPVIADNEFDYLFIVKLRKDHATLTVKKYGAKPVKMAGTSTMQPLQ